MAKILKYNLMERNFVRWECLRRNPEYIKCCKNKLDYHNIPASKLLNPELSTKAVKSLRDKYYLNRKSKKLKQGYKTFTEYQILLTNLVEIDDGLKGGQPIIARDGWGWFMQNRDRLKKEMNVSKTKKEYIINHFPCLLEVKINLNYRKEEIMNYLEKKVGSWLSLMQYLGMNKITRTIDYDIIRRYLNLYDLRNSRPRLTFQQIAVKMYPSAANKNLESAIQQVKREYKNAEYYINGGYKDIR